MGLREDVKFIVQQESQYEFKIPNEDTVLQQAILTVKRGKSTGNVALDRKAMNDLNSKGEER